MKQYNKFLALILALVMVLSNAHLGLVQAVSAAEVEYDQYVTTGSLLKDAYGITEAEKTLIDTYLVSQTYGYNVPTNDQNLIYIGEGTVKVEFVENWKIGEVRLVLADSTVYEKIELDSNGEGNYTYTGNVFTIEVDYVRNQKVNADTQALLLGAIAEMKRALADLETTRNVNLAVVTEAIPTLVDIADNGITPYPGFTRTLDDATVKSIYALTDMMVDGKLALEIENSSITNPLKYLFQNGQGYQDLVQETYIHLYNILHDSVLSSKLGMEMLQQADNDAYLMVQTFMGNLTELVGCKKDECTHPENKCNGSLKAGVLNHVNECEPWDLTAIKADVDFDALLAAVNAIEAPTAMPEIVEELYVDTATVNKGRSMWNVNITVVVETLGEDNELFNEYVGTGKVTLIDGTTAADAGVAVDAAVAEILGTFDLSQHEQTAETALPETLKADTTYTITYSPKKYAITTNYGADETVYFGHVYTLSPCVNEGMEYDYYVNGAHYLEGSKIVITGATEITRNEVPDYTHFDLYTVIADNFGNAAAKDILKSGVLLGSDDIRVQVPSLKDVSLELKDDALTVTGAYVFDAKYSNLNWVLHYGEEGNETAFESDTAECLETQVNYSYVLNLTNYTAADVQAVMDMVAGLKVEAAQQKNALDRLFAYYSDLIQMDDITIGALQGIVNTCDFGLTDETKILELREHFKTSLGEIGAECQNLAAVMGAENNNTLRYYYPRSAKMTASVAALSGYLNEMLPNAEYENYLGVLFDSLVGTKFEEYIQYKEKISTMKNSMAEINADLKMPNELIDLSSANVVKLADMLQNGEAIEFASAAVPSIQTEALTVVDSDMVTIQVNIYIDGVKKTISLTQALPQGTVLGGRTLDELQNKINNYIADTLKFDEEFYTVTGNRDVMHLAGVELNETYTADVSFAIKHYPVYMNGVEYEQITAADSTIDLPEAEPGYEHHFLVNGAPYEGASYTFSLDEIRAGALNVTYTVVDVKTGHFEEEFGNSDIFTPVKNEAGEYVGLNAVVGVNQTEGMEFAMALMEAGYSYVGLNGKTLIESTGDGLLVHAQTLIDALMADPTFGSDKIVELGLGNGMSRSAFDNHFLSSTIQLGNAKDEILWDLDFNIFMASIPSQLVEAAKALEAVDGYFEFYSAGDHMEVEIKLPEKVYELYLTGMLASGYKSNDDLKDVNIEVAYRYVCDAIKMFGDSSITVDDLQATLDKLQIDRDLTNYKPYYNKIKSAIVSGAISVLNMGDFVGVGTAAQGETIDALMGMYGLSLLDMTAGAAQIKEIADNSSVFANANVTIIDVPTSYEAVVIDAGAIKPGVKEFTDGVTYGDLLTLVKGQGLANVVDYTENLADRLSTAGSCVVMLLDDIQGDLHFNGHTILDLNGKTVNGSISANGKLIILDSNLVTDNAGTVTGNVSGNAALVAGKYPGMSASAVEAILPDGYKYENGVVSNALYIVTGEEDNLNFVINADFMHDESVEGYVPSVKAMAADIVVDLITREFVNASLYADGNKIYDIGLDRILSIKDEDEPFEVLINSIMDCVGIEGTTTFTNKVIADLLAFGDIATAIKNETPVATYTLSASPWTVEFYKDGSHVDVGVISNPNAAHETTVSLTFVGENREKMVNLFEHLDRYVDAGAELSLAQPKYDDRVLYLAGEGFAKLDIDLTSNKDWQTVIAVILAYGNPDKADALVNAIGDELALKAVFNTMTVEEVFTATKVMNRATSFAEMAESLGVELEVPGRDILEKLFHLSLVGFGKVLEKLDITGFTDKTMGMLEVGNTGRYELAAATKKHADATFRGFTLDVKGVLGTTGVSVAIFDEMLEIEYSRMILANSLAMDFAFAKDQLEDWTGYYVEVVKTYADGRPDVVVQVPVEQWGTDTINGKTYYFATFNGIAAKEMADQLYVTICNAEGEVCSNVWVDSVRAYAMDLLNLPMFEGDEELHIVAVDMLNYGAESQVYFGYNAEDLANNELTEAQKELATDGTPATENTADIDDVNYVGSSLTLKSKILLNMAFKNGVEGMYAEYSFTDHYGNLETGKADLWIDDAGFAIVDIDEIAVADGRQMVTITVYNADGTVYASAIDSMESYISRMKEIDKDSPLFDLIMKFSDSAYNYFH